MDPKPEMKCPTCQGCGKVANTPSQEPWTHWENLPLKNAGAVVAGLVKPQTCPGCQGTGKVSSLMLIDINPLRERISELKKEITESKSYSGPEMRMDQEFLEIKVLEGILSKARPGGRLNIALLASLIKAKEVDEIISWLEVGHDGATWDASTYAALELIKAILQDFESRAVTS